MTNQIFLLLLSQTETHAREGGRRELKPIDVLTRGCVWQSPYMNSFLGKIFIIVLVSAPLSPSIQLMFKNFVRIASMFPETFFFFNFHNGVLRLNLQRMPDYKNTRGNLDQDVSILLVVLEWKKNIVMYVKRKGDARRFYAKTPIVQ